MQTDDDDVDAEVRGRLRRRLAPGHDKRLSPRFTAQERADFEAASASVALSTSRFCAEATLAAARREPVTLVAAQEREELARLQRQLFAARTAVVRLGTNVNQVIAALPGVGEMPDWLERAVALTDRSVGRLDDLIAEVDRRLR